MTAFAGALGSIFNPARIVKKLITISLLANIVVLVPVCSSLVLGGERVAEVFGEPTPARGILLSIYGSILVSSGLLLIKKCPKMVAALLLVQVLYKITTPATVGSFQHPVVISNLVVAALHTLTLVFIVRTAGNPFKDTGVAENSAATPKA